MNKQHLGIQSGHIIAMGEWLRLKTLGKGNGGRSMIIGRMSLFSLFQSLSKWLSSNVCLSFTVPRGVYGVQPNVKKANE